MTAPPKWFDESVNYLGKNNRTYLVVCKNTAHTGAISVAQFGLFIHIWTWEVNQSGQRKCISHTQKSHQEPIPGLFLLSGDRALSSTSFCQYNVKVLTRSNKANRNAHIGPVPDKSLKKYIYNLLNCQLKKHLESKY